MNHKPEKSVANRKKAILETFQSEGFSYIIEDLHSKLEEYERRLTYPALPNPEQFVSGVVFMDENWTWYLRGKVYGYRALIKYFFGIDRWAIHKGIKYIMLWRGFCFAIAEFLEHFLHEKQKKMLRRLYETKGLSS